MERAKAESGRYCVSAHSLAEFYNALTGGAFQVPPSTALDLLKKNVLDRCSLVNFEQADHMQVLGELAKAGLPDGIVYDGLIAQAGRKSGTDELVTSNIRHFKKLGSIFSGSIRPPQ